MAEPKIGSLSERKARVLMESDTLRYNLQLQGQDVAASSRMLIQGIQVFRMGASFVGLVASLRNGNGRKKRFYLPRLLFRLLGR